MFRRKTRPKTTRLFFATDLHGSEACFRKFLSASKFYDAPVLILGGDIVGKLLIPILDKSSGHYSATYGEETYADVDSSGLRALTAKIRAAGHYYVVGDRDALAELDDPAHCDKVFRKAVYDTVSDWVALADERLRGTGTRIYAAPGNDDFLEIDSAFQGSDVIEFAEGRCLSIHGEFEMITTGYSNPTPWQTERELPEPALKSRLTEMVADVKDPSKLVAVLHAPPYRSGLDSAPKLDENLNMSLDMGAVETAPVGSRAVRDFIEEHQPLLGLHGHVHEGRGAVTIGRTLCLNPGSEYMAGVLAGALVELGDGSVVTHQLVTG